jgi:uncharacterized protein (DUF934 family)
MNSSAQIPVWKDGALVDDPWRMANPDAEDAALQAQSTIVPLDRFAENPEAFLRADQQIAIYVPGGGDIAPLVPHLARIALIALEFASFADGRNYSTARLLREKYDFSGELRAVGEVLADQIPLMRRCGINAYSISHAPTLKALQAGELAEVRRHYQPADSTGRSNEIPAGTRPWARQTVTR